MAKLEKLNALFKAYDIRGRTPSELDSTIARDIGRALADLLPPGRVAVGRDMRDDSKQLQQALMAGLSQQGRSIEDLGECSSDMVYYAVGARRLAGGAMITASHLGTGANGIKLTGAGVTPIGADSGLSQIKQAVAAGQYKIATPSSDNWQTINLTEPFVEHALQVAQVSLGPISALSIGYDAGNGMAAIFLDSLRARTPLLIEGLYTEPDGDFPNHPANPLIPQNTAELRQLVTERGLNAGLAFDGDGDRCFVIDETGTQISASLLGALLIRELLERNPGRAVVYGATASKIVPDTIIAAGGQPVISRVGHSFIKEQMHTSQALLGVEASGHFYFADNYYADSGLIAGLCALAILSNAQLPLSALIQPLRRYVDSGEINLPLRDFDTVKTLLKRQFGDAGLEEIDGLSISYPDWWCNVRPSNTEPTLRLNVEGRDPELVRDKTTQLVKLLTEA